MKHFTLSEVARHNKENDNYIVIDDKVYDVTRFSKFHPVSRTTTSVSKNQIFGIISKKKKNINREE